MAASGHVLAHSSNHGTAAMADTRQTHAIEYVKGDWDKAQYLPDPHVDNLTAVVMGLGTEFWAMRRRMMVIESLLEQNKVVNRAAIEAYRPTEAESSRLERRARRPDRSRVRSPRSRARADRRPEPNDQGPAARPEKR